MKSRLVKLRLELSEVSSVVADWYSSMFRLFLVKETTLYKHRGDYKYPVSEKHLYELCRCERLSGKFIIGIRPERLSTSQYEEYKEVLSVEYGVNGVTIRLIRRVLEKMQVLVEGGS